MRFFLGTHETSWLGRTDVPLFISRRRLSKRKALPVARGPWALDSGGFSELSMYGEWRTSESEYIGEVRRYRDEIGKLEWAAPQDWMCEPWILAKTGLTITEHQWLTVSNFLRLRELAPELPWVPVLQGWHLADYVQCIGLYGEAGVDLFSYPLVGLGTICRRQAMFDAEVIVRTLAGYGLRLHGFGVKLDGLARYGDVLTSADSLAWSYGARRHAPLPGCRHKSCANCIRWALAWREKVLGNLASVRQHQIPLCEAS